MSTTLRKVAALHIDQISGGDQSKDSQLKYPMIIARIRHLLNDFIKPLIYEGYNDDSKIPPSNFIVNYEITVVNDVLGAYVDLPDFYLSLPHGRGIHRVIQRIPVGTMPGQFTETEIIPTQSPSINQNTRAGRYPTHKKYYVEGQRIRLQNIYADPGQTNKLIVQTICAAPDSIGENDILPISPEQVSQVLLKLNGFIYPVPLDKLNNDNPDIR
jgi:hypothetical protein